MKLTKQNIANIDGYFKKSGIGHWDIRLEMIDHVASKLESMEGSYDFEFAFKKVLKDIGWTGNLKWLERERLLAINKITRKAYFKISWGLLTGKKSVLLLFAFAMLYFGLYQVLSFKSFAWLSLSMILLPVFFILIHSIVTYFKINKVGYLTYGSFYASFSVLMTNGFYQLFRPGGIFELDELLYQQIFIGVSIVNLVLTCAGSMLYWKYYRQFNALHEQLYTKP